MPYSSSGYHWGDAAAASRLARLRSLIDSAHAFLVMSLWSRVYSSCPRRHRLPRASSGHINKTRLSMILQLLLVAIVSFHPGRRPHCLSSTPVLADGRHRRAGVTAVIVYQASVVVLSAKSAGTCVRPFPFLPCALNDLSIYMPRYPGRHALDGHGSASSVAVHCAGRHLTVWLCSTQRHLPKAQKGTLNAAPAALSLIKQPSTFKVTEKALSTIRH